RGRRFDAVELDGFALALERNVGPLLEPRRVASQQPARVLADQHDISGGACRRLDPCGYVDGVADDAELQSAAAPNVASDDGPRVEADANAELAGEFLLDGGRHLEGGCERLSGMVVLSARGAEDGEQAVADELIDVAAVRVDHRDDSLEQAIDRGHDLRSGG